MQDTVADKPGRLVPVDCLPVIIGAPQPFASRGGLKLDHALKQFHVLPLGKNGEKANIILTTVYCQYKLVFKEADYG